MLRNLSPIPVPDSRTDTLIFDLDGTLVDSLPDLAAAVNRLLAAEGRPALPEPRIRGMVGDGVAKLVERGLAAGGLRPDAERFAALLARFHADYRPRSAERSQPYPAVAELLPRLAGLGWRVAVCTNKPQDATLHMLQAMGLLSCFTAIAGGDRYGVHKPDPRHLTRLAEEIGIAPGRAIMVGDGPQDLAAARGAGMRAIAALYGYGRERMTPQDLEGLPILTEFGALPAALTEAMR